MLEGFAGQYSPTRCTLKKPLLHKERFNHILNCITRFI
ncbi:MAG: hypothetical protein JW395_2830 [Nitrospira sp.]|nr:hypothetical protein [Nitrospira sp.]